VELYGAGAQTYRRAAALLHGKAINQALGGAWFYVLETDDVRGDKLLLLGGVAKNVTAHTPASDKYQYEPTELFHKFNRYFIRDNAFFEAFG